MSKGRCVFNGARFYTSAACIEQLPVREEYHEIAFVGRSNAGKSRAINALVGQKKMAFMSKKPGKTRLINFFEIPRHQLFLVDLPGYGYAAVSKEVQLGWEAMMSDYLLGRDALLGVVLLSDSRHPLNEHDMAFLAWFRTMLKPVHLVLTKSDQLNRSQQVMLMRQTEERLKSFPIGVSSVQLMSSLKRTGIDQLADTVLHWLS